MISKKTKKADLESRKKSYLQLGFLVAISFTLVAFEWSTNEIIPYGIETNLTDEVSPEIINEIVVSKPHTPKPIPKPVVLKTPVEVIVSKVVQKIVVKKKPLFFEEIDFSEFLSEGENDSIEIDPIKYIPLPKTYNAGSSLFDGILPHYKECEGLPKDQMFDCISDEINYKIAPNPSNIRSLSYTGEQLVRATFTVDEKGNIISVYIHGEKKFEKDLLKEVQRAIFELPPMIPGSQGGALIKARFTLPIIFKIQ